LWAIAGAAAQDLDSPSIPPACPFSWQATDLNEINNLAQIRANPDGLALGVRMVAAQHVFWG
jgi:hypothetical protein